MADIVMLPTAAAQPVINPKRMGRRARGGKVTLVSDFTRRRCLRERSARERAAADAQDIRAAERRGATAFELSRLSFRPDILEAMSAAAHKDARLKPLLAAMVGEEVSRG